jgi:hypothetical protein
LGYRFDPEDYSSLSRLATALQGDADLEKRLFSPQTMRFLQKAARSPCLPGFRFQPEQAEGLATLAEDNGILSFAERLCTNFAIPLTLADAKDLLALKRHRDIHELLDTLKQLGYRSPGLPYLTVRPITFLGQVARATELHSLLPAYGEIRSRLKLPAPQNNDLLIDLYALSYHGAEQGDCGLNLAQELVQNGERVDLKDLYLLDRICRKGQEPAALSSPGMVRAKVRLRLEELAHIKREGMGYDESPVQIDRLPAVKLLKVALFLDALADPAFQETIWQLIEQDLADFQAEIGGVVNWQRGRLLLEVVPSVQTDNLRYAPPERYRYNTRIARFHLHGQQFASGVQNDIHFRPALRTPVSQRLPWRQVLKQVDEYPILCQGTTIHPKVEGLKIAQHAIPKAGIHEMQLGGLDDFLAFVSKVGFQPTNDESVFKQKEVTIQRLASDPHGLTQIGIV